MNPSPLRTHWFFLAAPMILVAAVYAGLSSRGEIDRILEAGLLFDLVVLTPCLYWLCYRKNGRRAVTRAAALACLGVWVALKLVPESERQILEYVAPLRYVGLAALIWLELVVVVAIFRTVFRGGSAIDAAAHAPADIPPWVARLLAMEAKFWLKAWQLIKRTLGKK